MLTFRLIVVGLIFVFLLTNINGEKILGIFPFPGPSQYIVAEPYFKALAARGHELTVISQFPQKQKLPNFRDITIKSDGYEDFMKATIDGDMSKIYEIYGEFLRNVTLLVLDNEELQELMNEREHQFDLIIVETMLIESVYALARHFNAHLIGISTYGTDVNIDNMVGNQSPLSYIPVSTTNFTDHMDFWQRLQNLLHAALGRFFMLSHLEQQNRFYRKYFPHLPYELNDICRNFSLILLNQHYSLSFPRPYVPNMIEVGGMFISESISPLPKDIQDFINSAEDGVIYFSMGSNIKSKYLSLEKREAILNVFSSLKQKVLWKFEDPDLSGKPENVLIRKWFPQSDILAHSKVQLFITHGGLLSTMEAIYHAKPVVGIPVYFDQFMNIERAKKIGFGTSVSYTDLNEDLFEKAILEVLQNDTYTNAAQRISKRFRDQPMKPLDKAIFWTEYILRNNGGDFMCVAAKDLTFIQYHSLDTLGFLALIFFLAFVSGLWMIKKSANYIYKLVVRKKNKGKVD